jgi:hypothetical protein
VLRRTASKALVGSPKTTVNQAKALEDAKNAGLGIRFPNDTPSVIADVSAEMPKHFPARVFDAIATGMQRAARQLEAMPSE